MGNIKYNEKEIVKKILENKRVRFVQGYFTEPYILNIDIFLAMNDEQLLYLHELINRELTNRKEPCPLCTVKTFKIRDVNGHYICDHCNCKVKNDKKKVYKG